MDAQTHDRIAKLCTEAGAMMEDASVVALTLGSLATADMRDALDQLERSARQINALIANARSLAV